MVAPARFTPAATTLLYRCASCNGTGPAAQYAAHKCGKVPAWASAPTVYIDHASEKTVVHRPRDGSHAEEALYAALAAAGYDDMGVDGGVWDASVGFLRGYPWGLYLTPRRRFQADAAFPAARLLIEVDGIAHKIGSRQKGDVLKGQLAEAAGWRVLHLLPEQVHDGRAVELVRAALARGTP